MAVRLGVVVGLLGVAARLLGVSMRFFSMAVGLLGVAIRLLGVVVGLLGVTVTQRLSVLASMVGLLSCGGYIGILSVILAVGW